MDSTDLWFLSLWLPNLWLLFIHSFCLRSAKSDDDEKRSLWEWEMEMDLLMFPSIPNAILISLLICFLWSYVVLALEILTIIIMNESGEWSERRRSSNIRIEVFLTSGGDVRWWCDERDMSTHHKHDNHVDASNQSQEKMSPTVLIDIMFGIVTCCMHWFPEHHLLVEFRVACDERVRNTSSSPSCSFCRDVRWSLIVGSSDFSTRGMTDTHDHDDDDLRLPTD